MKPTRDRAAAEVRDVAQEAGQLDQDRKLGRHVHECARDQQNGLASHRQSHLRRVIPSERFTGRLKKPRVATLEEVRISKEGTSAIIEFRDPAWATTHLALGYDTTQLTDQEILERYNDTIE